MFRFVVTAPASLPLAPKPHIEPSADDIRGVFDVDASGRQEAVLRVQRDTVRAEVVMGVFDKSREMFGAGVFSAAGR